MSTKPATTKPKYLASTQDGVVTLEAVCPHCDTTINIKDPAFKSWEWHTTDLGHDHHICGNCLNPKEDE